MRDRWIIAVVFPIAFQPAASPAQGTPALIRDAKREISASRGSAAQAYRIASANLRETREIYVVLPASFARSALSRRYPVTIVLDGEDNVPPIAAVSDELSRNGQIPEAIIVAIPNTVRIRDLTPPGLSVSGSSLHEGGDRFLDFIERELLPAVDRQFRGGEPRTLIGHSSGGILATYAAATRPGFRAVVAIDTPTELGDDWLPRKLIARATSAPSVPLRYASYESRFGWRDDTWQRLAGVAPPSWQMHRERVSRESHESIGMIAMYLGLREVFRDYSMLSAPTAPTTRILAYYDGVGSALGSKVVPPRKLLLQVLDDLLAEGQGTAARAAYDVLTTGYGEPSNAAATTRRIATLEQRGAPTETIERLFATPFPTPDEARAYIGEWIGDVRMGLDQPRTGSHKLRITVVEGRVVGETVRRSPTGDDVKRWEYLRITPSGMTWGFLNGMRPRAVALFEGTLTGDTLSGAMRFGGMDFRAADGGPPPPLYFSFARVRQ